MIFFRERTHRWGGIIRQEKRPPLRREKVMGRSLTTGLTVLVLLAGARADDKPAANEAQKQPPGRETSPPGRGEGHLLGGRRHAARRRRPAAREDRPARRGPGGPAGGLGPLAAQGRQGDDPALLAGHRLRPGDVLPRRGAEG